MESSACLVDILAALFASAFVVIFGDSCFICWYCACNQRNFLYNDRICGLISQFQFISSLGLSTMRASNPNLLVPLVSCIPAWYSILIVPSFKKDYIFPQVRLSEVVHVLIISSFFPATLANAFQSCRLWNMYPLRQLHVYHFGLAANLINFSFNNLLSSASVF